MLFVAAAWGVILLGGLYSASIPASPVPPHGGLPVSLEAARLMASGPLPFLLMAAAGLSLSILLLSCRPGASQARHFGRRDVAGVIESLDAIVWVADASTLRALFVSQGVERILGFAYQPWLADWDFLRTHIHPDDRRDVVARIRTCAERGRGLRIEYRAFNAEGEVVWLRNAVQVVEGADGRPCRLHGVIVEVTESRRREESLQRESHLLGAMLEQAPVAAAFLDRELAIVRVSARWAQVLGRPVEEWEGRSGLDVVSDPEVRAALQGVRDTGRPYVAREKLVPLPGETQAAATYWDWHVRAVRDPEGGIEGLVVSLVDVTGNGRARREVETVLTQAPVP